MKLDHTERGFEIVDFEDRNERACSLQQSSAIGDGAGAAPPGSSCVWIGAMPSRVHLGREQAAEIGRRLLAWVTTGSLKIEGD